MTLSKEKNGYRHLVKNLDLLSNNREIDRQTWLSEVFPEWGTYLNDEIENTTVKSGTFGRNPVTALFVNIIKR